MPPARRSYAAAALAAPLVAAAAPLAAQQTPQGAPQGTGSIAGRVTDAGRRPLVGALVRADHAARGTSAGATAGRDGAFRFDDLPAGTHRVVARYLGFQPETVTVTVAPGRPATADLVMRHPVAAALAQVRVVGQTLGQAAALNQQRAADNISTVIDNELVGRLPDQNLAEAVARAPGVAIDRDQGEGRYVQIRGTRQDLNALSLNGERLPTPENSASSVSGNNTSGRAIPMDVIPADQAAVIQVSKTLTPDLDADAIGGNVNIVTRTARSGPPTLNATAAAGQNVLGRGPLQNFALNGAGRFGPGERFGLALGGTYFRNDRASQNFEGTWCVQNGDCGPTTAPSAASPDVPRLWETRDYPQVNRTRQGANGTLDYRLGERSTLFLRGSYSMFTDDELRFRTRYGFRAGSGSRFTIVTPDSGTTTGSRMDRDLRLRELNWRMSTAQLAGEHGFGEAQKLTWSVATARATDDRPDTRTMVFRQNGMAFAYNFADADRPRVAVTAGSFDDPARFAFNNYTNERRLISDQDVSARLNYEFPVRLGGLAATLKAGGVVRSKRRSNDVTTRISTSALGTNTLGATPATLFSRLSDGGPRNTTFDGFYPMGLQASPAAVAAFIRDNPTAFTPDRFNSDLSTLGAQFRVREVVSGGYLMATVDAGPVRLIPGLRVEATRTSNQANRLAATSTTVTATPTTGRSDYVNLFPSLTANWRPDELTVVRAAATTSLARPNFADIAPSVQITAGNVTATVGNPALRPTRAVNLDLTAERYFRTVGFVSGGVFYKRLTDFIYPSTRPRQPDEQLGPDATAVVEPVNGPRGTVYGAEAAWQQNLTFLPGLLSGLGVNLNYTYTRSASTFPLRGAQEFSIPGQTGNAGNAGIFYERGPLSLRTGVNYNGKFRVTVSPLGPQADTYRLARTQVDAAASVRLPRGARLFAEAVNLTNTPYRASVGDRDNRGGGGDDPSFEFYRPWYTFGLKVER